MSLLSNLFDLTREAALVTGAGNGIGRAIAQSLVDEGVKTVFAGVNKERVQAAVAASSRPAVAVPWVGDLAGLERLRCFARRRAVCAGSGHPFRPQRQRATLTEYEGQALSRSLEVGGPLDGQVGGTRAVEEWVYIHSGLGGARR
jgi:NAD(P)-dependent dehydrogenase (short-subunit alcohol dehydrogenase family)